MGGYIIFLKTYCKSPLVKSPTSWPEPRYHGLALTLSKCLQTFRSLSIEKYFYETILLIMKISGFGERHEKGNKIENVLSCRIDRLKRSLKRVSIIPSIQIWVRFTNKKSWIYVLHICENENSFSIGTYVMFCEFIKTAGKVIYNKLRGSH